MNSAMRATGTEMSCLIEPPSPFWASDAASRSRHSIRGLRERTPPPPHRSMRSAAGGVGEHGHRAPAGAVPSAIPEISTSAYQGASPASGRRVPGI